MNLVPEIEEKSAQSHLSRGEEDYNEVFFNLFGLFVGKGGKKFTPQEISSATGLSSSTIENYCQRISAPSFPKLAILCEVLPFEFKSRFINLLGGADLAAEIRRDYTELFEAMAEKNRRGEL